MKALKFTALVALATALVGGCGKEEQSAAPAAPKVVYGPKIPAYATTALGWRNREEGPLGKCCERQCAKLCEMRDGALRKLLESMSRAGLDAHDCNWVLVTAETPELCQGLPRSVPNVAVAISIPHDLDRIVAALGELPGGKDVTTEKTELAGRPVLKIAGLSERVSALGVDLHVASLDGQLLIVASNPECMVAQLRLYCEGVGESDGFPGFTLGKDDFLRVAVRDVGRIVTDNTDPDELVPVLEMIPDGDRLVAGLGTIEFSMCSTDGSTLTIRLAVGTASEEHAGTLADVAAGFLQPIRAQVRKSASRGDSEDFKLLDALLSQLQIAAVGKTFVATVPSLTLSEIFDIL